MVMDNNIREKLVIDKQNAFIARMSHDMRTSMNSVIGLTLLAEEKTDDPDLLKMLDGIEDSGRHMMGIVNNSVELLRFWSGTVELVRENYSFDQFKENIESVIKPQLKEKDLKFMIRKTEPSMKNIYVDTQRLGQMIVSILMNAVDASYEHGTIELVLSLGGTKSARTIKFEVTDTGRGMSREFAERCFEPFAKEDPRSGKGTGLGLSIAREVAELFGGEISIESRPGKGTVVTAEIPAEQAPDEAYEGRPAGEAKGEAFDPAGRNILLADDDHVNLRMAKRMLENKGYVVECAETGKEAVAAFEKSKAFHFSAVLLDIRMPEMDGLEAAKTIRSMEREDAESVPVIAMTANAFGEDVAMSMAAGMDAHLTKPVEPEDLFRTLAEMIQG